MPYDHMKAVKNLHIILCTEQKSPLGLKRIHEQALCTFMCQGAGGQKLAGKSEIMYFQ